MEYKNICNVKYFAHSVHTQGNKILQTLFNTTIVILQHYKPSTSTGIGIGMMTSWYRVEPGQKWIQNLKPLSLQHIYCNCFSHTVYTVYTVQVRRWVTTQEWHHFSCLDTTENAFSCSPLINIVKQLAPQFHRWHSVWSISKQATILVPRTSLIGIGFVMSLSVLH